jgi:hypothetical protein
MKLNTLIISFLLAGVATAFAPPQARGITSIYRQGHVSQLNAESNQNSNRRDILNSIAASGLALGTIISNVGVASALVEGNPAPGPGKKSPTKSLGADGTAVLSDMEAVVPSSAYKKLSSGVIYADLRQGKGDEIIDGSRVNMQWVLRKSNGYFVDSSEVQNGVPFIFTVGDKTAIVGLDEGVKGMRQSGTRRILIPPSLAYAKGLDDGCPGPLPAGYGPRQQMRRVQQARLDVPGEYVYLEVQVTRVR